MILKKPVSKLFLATRLAIDGLRRTSCVVLFSINLLDNYLLRTHTAPVRPVREQKIFSIHHPSIKQKNNTYSTAVGLEPTRANPYDYYRSIGTVRVIPINHSGTLSGWAELRLLLLSSVLYLASVELRVTARANNAKVSIRMRIQVLVTSTTRGVELKVAQAEFSVDF